MASTRFFPDAIVSSLSESIAVSADLKFAVVLGGGATRLRFAGVDGLSVWRWRLVVRGLAVLRRKSRNGGREA